MQSSLIEIDSHKRSSARRSFLQSLLPQPSLSSSPSQATRASNENLGYSVPIDPSLIETIEAQAKNIAADIDRVITNYEVRMSDMTKLALESVAIHDDAVQGLCSELGTARAEMMKLITAVDQMCEDMGGVVALSSQIKVLKEALSVIEKLPQLK